MSDRRHSSPAVCGEKRTRVTKGNPLGNRDRKREQPIDVYVVLIRNYPGDDPRSFRVAAGSQPIDVTQEAEDHPPTEIDEALERYRDEIVLKILVGGASQFDDVLPDTGNDQFEATPSDIIVYPGEGRDIDDAAAGRFIGAVIKEVLTYRLNRAPLRVQVSFDTLPDLG